MPSSDYTTTGGGLKLKGAKDASIDKKRKKKKATPSSATPHPDKAAPLDTNKDVALRKALEDEDGDAPESRSGGAKSTQVGGTSTGDVLGHGKTEAERRHEERRRKRVSRLTRALQRGESADTCCSLTNALNARASRRTRSGSRS